MNSIQRLGRLFLSPSEDKLDLERLFTVLSLAFLALAWLSLILAETGLFHWAPLALGLSLIVILSVVHVSRYEGVENPSKFELGALLFTISVSILNAIFFHDTFYGGRDPGVFANAAVYLSREGSLVVDRFINHPGWTSTDGHFTLNFDIAYVAWLGTFFSLGGLPAIRISNLIPTIVSLLAIFFVAKRLGGEYAASFTLLAVGTTFPFIWFGRGTYNEIFFMALVWIGILSLLIAWQDQHPGTLLLGVLSLGLAMHTRLEGALVFLAFSMTLLVLLFVHFRSRHPRLVGPTHLLLALAVAGHYVVYRQITQPHYLRTHYSVLAFLYDRLFVNSFSPSMPANPDAIRYHFPAFVYNALSAYHLMWPLLIIPLAILLASLAIRQKRSVQLLVVLAIIGPTLIFLKFPFVSLDQPWFLKRYVATVIPLGFLSTSVVVVSLLRRPLFLAPIISLVVILNLSTASPILLHQEYHGMIEFVGDLSEMFSEEDLVLVDRFATGNYKLADPLFFVFGVRTLWISSSSEFTDRLWREQETLSCSGSVFYLTSSESILHQATETVPEGSVELIWSRVIAFQELRATVDLLHYPGRPPDPHDMDHTLVNSLIEVPRDIRTRVYTVMVYQIDLEGVTPDC